MTSTVRTNTTRFLELDDLKGFINNIFQYHYGLSYIQAVKDENDLPYKDAYIKALLNALDEQMKAEVNTKYEVIEIENDNACIKFFNEEETESFTLTVSFDLQSDGDLDYFHQIYS